MSRIQRIGTWTAAFFFAFVFAGETFAGVRGGIRRGGHRRTVADHVVAYAALEALPGEAGWGRFVVRDDLLPSGDERSVQVSLFGLEPGAKYTVAADGVEVSLIVTDRKGDASVKLKTRGRHSGDVPSDLPAADEILRASVHDFWGGMILDGAFTVLRQHITDPTVHREKIHLEEEEGFDADGMAGVCRKESGAQGFATMASGLEPGLSYSIVVDTLVVGIVTADEEGQAGLELHVPDDENPLPDALQPVDNIRNVRWFQGDLLILSGVFTGESDMDDRCDELEGQFARLIDGGFVLRKGDLEVEIVVTDDTEFEGFDDLTQVVEGDWLEVKACWDGERLVAKAVELEEHERECWEKRGTFVELTENGFVLRVGGPETGADAEIVVTEDTEFEGFIDLAELEEGDRLAVEACWDGEALVAVCVKLLERDDCVEARGVVRERTDLGFVLEVGDDVIEVVVTDETVFKRFESLDALDGGEVIALEGCFDGEVLVAAWIWLLEDDDCAELRGVVVERTDHGFILRVGDDFLEVVATNETVLKNFDSLDQLDGGEVVWLEGCFDGEVLVAAWIKLLEDDDCAELHGTVIERTDHGFILRVGDDLVEIVVTNETVLKNFDSLDQLDGGEAVALEGCFEGDVLVAAWIILLEDDDCVELHGIVAERTDRGFVLQVGDDFVEVAVTNETELKGFDSLEELGVGDEVGLEGCFEGDVLAAAWVCLFERDECVELHGIVAERTDAGFVLQVGDDFVTVAVTDETVLKNFDSLEILEVGASVVLEGCFDSDVLVAAWVKLLEAEPQLEWWVADGTVVDLLEHGFTFEADGEVVVVKITDETVVDGYENADQIAKGDVVLVEGWWDGERVFAAHVVRPE